MASYKRKYMGDKLLPGHHTHTHTHTHMLKRWQRSDVSVIIGRLIHVVSSACRYVISSGERFMSSLCGHLLGKRTSFGPASLTDHIYTFVVSCSSCVPTHNQILIADLVT